MIKDFFFKLFLYDNLNKIQLLKNKLTIFVDSSKKMHYFPLYGLQINVVRSDKHRHRLSLFEVNFTLASIMRSRKTILSR